VKVTPAAKRELGNLPRGVQIRVATKIDEWSADPRPHGVKKLKGEPEVYRVRVGDYRVVYQIDGGGQTVEVTAIGDRKEIYRRGLG
jgi:mRNA interferase RelE/StbE